MSEITDKRQIYTPEHLRYDPLVVHDSKLVCEYCRNQYKPRRSCEHCHGEGFQRTSLANLWAPSPGFLVCGGPSINSQPFEKLAQRGIVSLAVNNVAGHVPVSAWCFSDPQNKFHQGVFTDPSIITFAPTPKLNKEIYAKTPDGKFHATDIVVRDCPSTYGFLRRTEFYPDQFLTTPFAQWGIGGQKGQGDGRGWRCLCTMILGLRLMCYLGCPRIYMLGVDFNMDETAQYSFKQTKAPRNRRYRHENILLKEIKPSLDEAGIEVFNCNPRSKCDVFDYVSFEDALLDCKGPVPPDPLNLSQWYDKSLVEEQVKAEGRKWSREDLAKFNQ